MAFTFFLPDGYSKADLVNLNRVHTKLGKIRRWLIPALRVVFTLRPEPVAALRPAPSLSLR